MGGLLHQQAASKSKHLKKHRGFALMAKKRHPPARLKFEFRGDKEAWTQTIGEIMATRIEQALRLLDLAKEAGDGQSIQAAMAMRAKAVTEIDEWARGNLGSRIGGIKGTATVKKERASTGAEPLKKDMATAEARKLLQKGKEVQSIPGIIANKGICSERYARSALNELLRKTEI
jgi:hypothetical protein